MEYLVLGAILLALLLAGYVGAAIPAVSTVGLIIDLWHAMKKSHTSIGPCKEFLDEA